MSSENPVVAGSVVAQAPEVAAPVTAPAPQAGASRDAAEPGPSTVDDEAYEPTYAEAFPPLPLSEPDLPADPARAVAAPSVSNHWASNRFAMRTSTVTQVFCVPMEERRFKQERTSEEGFGEQGQDQAKICSDIMARTTGVSIEMSSAKDRSLTVVLTGKADAVMRARKLVVQQLQTQARVQVKIPKEHHRHILGAKGARLQALELETATKISIPRTEEDSDYITICGTKEGIEKSRHEIQLISDEQAKLAFVRMDIEKIYHPFICGPNNDYIKALMKETGARISVPPPSVHKDEIVVAGEKDGVHTATQAIEKIYDEKKRKCQTVSVEVHKSQHKYVIGPRGTNLNDILEKTGVSVEVPPSDSTSETITLRGEQEKLGSALTEVYSKANSVIIGKVEAPAWLHRFIIGKKGANINLITTEYPKVHIEFREGQEEIELEGPPEDVEAVRERLDKTTRDLISRISFDELTVEQKYHKHVIGRAGANVARIKENTGVSIRIPPDNENSNVIRIEGSPEGVAQAKQELMDMVHKMENEKSKDIIIEQRFHKTMIGASGGKIKEVRDKFNQVQINFPDPAKKSDVVTLRGPKNDVDKCFRYMQQMRTELIANNYVSEVKIFKQFHKNIIGKGGANIRSIRDETETRIDLPSENSDSDLITITGKKPNVEQAVKRIEDIQKDLNNSEMLTSTIMVKMRPPYTDLRDGYLVRLQAKANIKEVAIEIPYRYHNAIIGAKGHLIRSVMEECGGVIIRFPPEGSTSDKVTIRGPTEDVEKARRQLMDLSMERKEQSFTEEVRAKPEYHKFLIGRGGAHVRRLRENTGARVIFPSSNDADQELITVIGTKESAISAKKELEELVKNLDNIVEMQIQVDPKFHRHFVVRRGEVLRLISEQYGGVSVSFPRSGIKSDVVTLKGGKDCVEGAKKRILEIVSDLESQVSMECVISQKFHRTVMGQRGCKVKEVTQEHDVAIKFPDRPTEEDLQPEQSEVVTNGDGGVGGDGDAAPEPVSPIERKLPRKFDVILITGKKENCEAASNALLALVPITREVSVPADYHRFIIGQRGREVRQMMDDHDVNISIPSANDQSDVIRVTGAPVNVDRAEEALRAKVTQLEADKEDRVLRNFKLEVRVAPSHHPKIIGRKGAVVSQIRSDHNVQIQFPARSAEAEDLITITGYEIDTRNAEEAILSIVRDLEDQTSEDVFVDHRVHPRIIGAKGRGIRKIMDEYKVDLKFPRPDAENPDLVVVSGSEDAVLDCKDYLLNLEEEYLQDIHDKELLQQYSHPPSRHNDDGGRHNKGDAKGFIVRDAPWSTAAPNTNSNDEFPEFGASVPSATPTLAWGPRRK